MKFSEQWLREWVNPSLDAKQLAEQLTMAGLEVDAVMPVAHSFTQVIVGEVLSVDPHPNADRLRVCQVNIGELNSLQIVCGAKNVRPGLKVPVAMIGAVLSPEITIKQSRLRGVESSGMLCSSAELGLTDKAEGLLELPDDAPLGIDIRKYLQLNDHIFELKVTTNRGDCLSIQGIAREVSALNEIPYKKPTFKEVSPAITEEFPIKVSAPQACSQYLGRIIRQVNLQQESPLWLREKLRRSGIRSINPVVDVANYVMLELGQPMHAFDLNKLQGSIDVRYARVGEEIALLNEQRMTLEPQTLIIADQNGPQNLAGVMGSIDSCISNNTTDVFLESAYFDPLTIAHAVQHYHLASDAASRFERGVDPTLQKQALERATELILQLAGGKPGPVTTVTAQQLHQQSKSILLRRSRIERVLGIKIPDQTVVAILEWLEMKVTPVTEGWQIVPPPYRFDQHQEADLIEELARIYGYNKIPSHLPQAQLTATISAENKIATHQLQQLLAERGYCEIISYSFIPEKLQRLLDPLQAPKKLLNPISQAMDVMRTNLLPGLLQAVAYNQNRQENRLRLFETGLCFREVEGQLQQTPKLAAITIGSVYPEQWGMPQQVNDFFDIKNDLESILALTGEKGSFSFQPALDLPQLHPHRSAWIYRRQEKVGYIGALHPQLQKELGLLGTAYVFEIDLSLINNAILPIFKVISKFPRVRRDIAVIVDRQLPAATLQQKIRDMGSELLKSVELFDIYQGEGIEVNKKSAALGLTFQHDTRTLTDEEVNQQMTKIINMLEKELGARLR